MIGLFCFALAVLASPFRSKLRLEAENAVLRHQLIVLRRRPRGHVRLTSWYEGLACQEVFSRSTFLPFRFERLTRAQFCIDGTAVPPCLAALSGQPPEPGRVAPEGARGWTAKARAEQ